VPAAVEARLPPLADYYDLMIFRTAAPMPCEAFLLPTHEGSLIQTRRHCRGPLSAAARLQHRNNHIYHAGLLPCMFRLRPTIIVRSLSAPIGTRRRFATGSSSHCPRRLAGHLLPTRPYLHFPSEACLTDCHISEVSLVILSAAERPAAKNS
jgi:hypothetical protein